MKTVGELAALTGITVRTLHHYDEIGLVTPSRRSPQGHRLYDDDDVVRLQQVLVLRALGLSLEAIADALSDRTDRAALLREHRAALVAKRGELDAMLAAIEHTLSTLERPMTTDDLRQMFDFDPSIYEAEAEQRWGDNYKESARRTKGYGKAEWAQIAAEATAINERFVALMTEGAPPADPRVQAAVAAHRDHITRWFYPCSAEIHRGLGEMYVADERFTRNLDKTAPGLARYLSAAIATSPR